MISRRAIMAMGAGTGAAAVATALGTGPAATDGLVDARRLGVEPDAPHDQTAALQRAIERGSGGLFLPPGRYIAAGLRIDRPVAIVGVPGLTTLVAGRAGDLISIDGAAAVTLSGLGLDGRDVAEHLVVGAAAHGLTVECCALRNAAATGISLSRSSGRVHSSQISHCGSTGIRSLDGRGIEIVHNHVHDIADNGIQVWQSEAREDGSIVAFNRIEHIAAKSGGNGPYGNGISVFRAGNVTVANNRTSDCVFSAVRANSAANIQIVDNSCSRLGEMAIYVEFAFEGAIVSGNLVEQAASGISVTNFDRGGRLAVVSGNIVRDLFGARSNPDSRAIGIAVEADTTVTGNVVENAAHAGLVLGWGYALRNVVATGNVVRNCGAGIAASVAKGAGSALIANNLIAAARPAIVGMDHDRPVTGDLAMPGVPLPAGLSISGNLVS